MICYYYLTFKCNCTCEFCRIWQDENYLDVEDPGIDVVGRNLLSLSKMGFRDVVFTGGEPFLRDDIEQVLHAAKKNGFFVSLFTNGLLHYKISEKISGLIDRLYVSLHAPEESEHNRISGQECFAESMESLRAANKYKMHPAINFTVTRDSVRFLPEMAELAESNDVMLRITPVHHFFGTEGFEKITVDYILRYSKKGNIEMNRAAMELLKNGGNSVKFPVCRALDTTVTIIPTDRIVLPCISAFQAVVPAEGRIEKVMGSDLAAGYRQLQGKLQCCNGCTDMDYLVPSFSRRMDKLRMLDLISRHETDAKYKKWKERKKWKLFSL